LPIKARKQSKIKIKPGSLAFPKIFAFSLNLENHLRTIQGLSFHLSFGTGTLTCCSFVEIVTPLKPWIVMDSCSGTETCYSGTRTCSSQHDVDTRQQVNDCVQGYGFDCIVDLYNVGCEKRMVSCSSYCGTYVNIFT